MKELKIIQVIARIAYILSLVVFISSIVGAAGCATGMLGLGTTANIVVDGQTIQQIVETKTGTTYGNLYSAMTIGGIICSYLIYLGWESKKYFEHELEDGDPFTEKGAVELRILAIKYMVASAAGTILAAIVFGIMKSVTKVTQDLSISNGGAFGTGLFFLFLSLVFQYGAGVKKKSE